MTQTEMNVHRTALLNKREELTNGSRGRAVLEVEATADEMEQTQGGQERDLAVGVINRDTQLLHDVRSALDRIQSNTYGLCVDCDREIGRKRLAAVPWAEACIVCQEAADQSSSQPWQVGEQPRVSASW